MSSGYQEFEPFAELQPAFLVGLYRDAVQWKARGRRIWGTGHGRGRAHCGGVHTGSTYQYISGSISIFQITR